MKLLRRRWRQARWIAREFAAGVGAFAKAFPRSFMEGFQAAQRGDSKALQQRNREEWRQLKTDLGPMMQEAGEALRNIDQNPCRYLLVERGSPALLFDTCLYLDEAYAASRPAPELAAGAVMAAACGDFGRHFRPVPRGDGQARLDVFAPPIGFGAIGKPGEPAELTPQTLAGLENRCVYLTSLAPSP